ncbi:MAG TPA: Crp/Fnr family transcriptional regulator [Gemmatimonadaceae bacterium]|nr:Crp/Fnr family transcriptional regulator [Gemmatimonadaceae bacterium]
MLSNRLIASLPGEDIRLLQPHLERVELEQRQVLFEPEDFVSHLYFPTTAVVSLVSAFRNGDAIEIGTVGREGVVGLPAFLSRDRATARAIVQLPGTAYRLSATALSTVASPARPLHGLILRYVQAFMAQAAQTAACNSAHLVEERCARWLLTTRDRVDGDEFPLTHEFLAFMLGVRRSGVTVAMRTLKEAGLVQYTRGKLKIVDRDRLQLASCECYAAVRANFDRVATAAMH